MSIDRDANAWVLYTSGEIFWVPVTDVDSCTRSPFTPGSQGFELFGMGYSWGGYESLMVPFDPRSQRTATHWPHAGPALRLHIGLDDPLDLKADLEAGLDFVEEHIEFVTADEVALLDRGKLIATGSPEMWRSP